MSRRIEDWLDRVLPLWVDAARRHAWAVVVATVLLTGVAAVYTASHLEVNTEEDSLFDDEVPHRVVESQYWKIFPNQYENIVILVDAPSPEQAGEAASALAARLEAAPELFSTVYLPQGEFFEEHALLYMDTEALRDFADRLARVQPYLASLAQDGSLRGLAMMLARGVRALRDGDVSADELEPMLQRVHAALQARLAGEPYHLSWAEVVAGRPMDEDANRRLILAQPIRDFHQLVAAGKPLGAVMRFAQELGLTKENGFSVRMTGDVALAYEEMQLVDRQARIAGIASFVMVAALMLFALRSLRVVLAALLSLVVGLVWTGTFAALAIGYLNLISVAFAVLFIGLGIDFGVHLGMGYQEALAHGRSHAESLRESARKAGGSLVLCAVTTAIGFYVFVPTDFSGVAELGLISGTGMLISLFCSFTVLPALLSLGLREETAARAARRAQMRLVPDFPVRHPLPVAIAGGTLAAGALFVLPQAHFDQNPLRVRDPSAVSVQAFQELLAQSRTSPWSLNAVRPDMESAEALAQELSRLPTVESAHTVKGYVPSNQEEKLEIIEDVAMFLAPPPDGQPAPPTVDQVVVALQDLEKELRLLVREGDSGSAAVQVAADVQVSIGRFLEDLRAEGPAEAEATVADLEESLVGSLSRQLDLLQRAVAVEPITVDGLPQALLSRMISESGMVRVQIFPKEDLTDPKALARFVESVQNIAPRASGSAVSIYSASRVVVGALQEAFTAAVIAIALLLLVIWRTVEDTALVMAPLVLAGVVTPAAAVLLGVPFNFADVIVLPLLLGIGVDTSIHLVHRARIAEPGEERLLQTSTANAVVFSALTTIASFGSLALASHRGMASLGQLLTLGVVVTVLCNLVVLPAVLELRRRTGGTARGGTPRPSPSRGAGA